MSKYNHLHVTGGTSSTPPRPWQLMLAQCSLYLRHCFTCLLGWRHSQLPHSPYPTPELCSGRWNGYLRSVTRKEAKPKSDPKQIISRTTWRAVGGSTFESREFVPCSLCINPRTITHFLLFWTLSNGSRFVSDSLCSKDGLGPLILMPMSSTPSVRSSRDPTQGFSQAGQEFYLQSSIISQELELFL